MCYTASKDLQDFTFIVVSLSQQNEQQNIISIPLLTELEYTLRFTDWTLKYGKIYIGPEYIKRLRNFKSTLDFIIQSNNNPNSTITLGLNEFSDWSDEEKKSLLGAMISPNRTSIGIPFIDDEIPSPPVSKSGTSRSLLSTNYIDWRTHSAVTSVKNQASCGSCYAFSAIAVIESALFKRGTGSFDFSEQDAIDCTYGRYGGGGFNFGCSGGDPATTIQHILVNGQASEVDYPYTSGNTRIHGPCKNVQRNRLNLNLLRVQRGSEDTLANALATGPIAVTLNAENNEFYNYAGGIYNNAACSTSINHAVLLVGYGQANGVEYWIIKNSWGTSWGENGFMRIAKGYNRCGIVSAEIDCTFGKYGGGFNFGCGGGDPATTIQHILVNGQASEVYYPYTSGTSRLHGSCRSVKRNNLGNLRLIRVQRGSEDTLANAFVNGPIVVTLNGENQEFYNYAGGIYNNAASSTRINHAVLLVYISVAITQG
ncbi:cysteine proteinase [Heterostelium album PN500]|uniref:Cysteine proteinase n=1 Tax=Heterostelium pallidum (strain ATCC 26659 / Pp 5 / PN500) TaxID=670386 RepID=D3BR92_HETP5|nr:cysteine proteinase [Heterostelium album PN500]EFA75924.1 cysteine proteinase [Heterostelium album PN500]|eukprot:XP_020428058.1 cysteine proteinase [Heterostelium album PN500]